MTFKTLESSIEKANQRIVSQWSQKTDDPYRPVYHPIAPPGWMNDPNGLIYVNGWYHVFYQWNPYGSVWGNMHWGHMRSKDLHNWEHLPTALAPEESYEKDGCFSGTAIEKEGQIYLFYTANIFEEGNHPYNAGPLALQTQALAKSKDTMTFEKFDGNPIIEHPPKARSSVDFRDPKVWYEDGRYYMMVGSRQEDVGELLKYQSDDLIHWEYVEQVVNSEGSLGYMLECPDVVRIHGREVLIFSPIGSKRHGGKSVSGYIVKTIDGFDINSFKCLDQGQSFYAPQTFNGLTESLMLGWIPMPFLKADEHNWSGCLSLPRELLLTESGLLSSIPRLSDDALNHSICDYEEYLIKPKEKLEFRGDTVLLTMGVSLPTAGLVHLKLKASKDGELYTSLMLDAKNGRMVLDWSNAGELKSDTAQSNNFAFESEDFNGDGLENERSQSQRSIFELERPYMSDTVDLKIFIDKSIIEVYGFNGQCVMTAVVFSNPTNDSIFIENTEHKELQLEFLRINEITPSTYTLNEGIHIK